MPDLDAINDSIESAITDPKRVRIGNEESEQQTLADQLAAAKHLAANTQAASARKVVFNKISPPGAA